MNHNDKNCKSKIMVNRNRYISLRRGKRVCYTGKRGMGSLEYEPDSSVEKDVDELISMTRMSDFASAILEEKKDILLSSENDLDYKQLLRLGTSAG